MSNIIDFIMYQAAQGVVTIDEDDDDCDRPFHARLNIGRGGEDFVCRACLVDVDLVFHPSFDGGLWVERGRSNEQS